MKKQLTTLLSVGLLIGFTACKEDPKPAPPAPTAGVLVGSEGAFTAGTGSISAYNSADKTVEHNLYQKANTTPMGNTLQSILVDGDITFLVLSGSGEIAVVESDSYKLIRRIKGLGTPRYIQKIADNKYYITDWFEGGVLVYNYEGDKINKTIQTGSGPETMLKHNNLVFVANAGELGTISQFVTVIHAEADTVMTQLKVGDNPNSMQVDAEEYLWVLSSGYLDQTPSQNTPGTLISFDLAIDSLEWKMDSLVVADSLVFSDPADKPNKLQINQAGDKLYYLNQFYGADLMRFNTTASVLPMNPFIDGSFYGVAYDSENAEIYLTDPKDFNSIGDVYRYDENAVELDRFQGGLIPSSFGFK